MGLFTAMPPNTKNSSARLVSVSEALCLASGAVPKQGTGCHAIVVDSAEEGGRDYVSAYASTRMLLRERGRAGPAGWVRLCRPSPVSSKDTLFRQAVPSRPPNTRRLSSQLIAECMKRPGASRWGDVMDQVKLDLGPGLVMPVFCKGGRAVHFCSVQAGRGRPPHH